MTMDRPQELWSAMPGWGIVVDLTPPELINSRRLTVLRKLIALGLVALLALCVAGYVVAAGRHSAATTALNTVQARTTQLRADTRPYAGITKMQGTVTEVRGEIAKLMGGDVDLTLLMDKIRSSLPGTMTIGHESVTISLAGVAGPGAATTPASGVIGNVTLSGAGRTLDDVSAYVDALKVIPGIVDVNPISNVSDKAGVQYSLSMNLTSQLLSHQFDVTRGSK